MKLTPPWLHLLLALSLPATAAEPAQTASGLEYRQFGCTVHGRALTFDELMIKPGHGLELGALANPSARPNPRCRDGYGGSDLTAILDKPVPGFDIEGATNGTFFHKAKPGYASNSLLWSRASGLISPLRRHGGTHLFIADGQGGHEASLGFEACKKEPCARLGFAGQPQSRALNTHDILALLKSKFPTMTLAVQSNIPLMNGEEDAQGRFTHYTACPAPGRNDWRCALNSRTVLCARADKAISLLTTPVAAVFDLADGLRVGGACHADCVLFYNLDGGGSTQMAHRDQASGKPVVSGRKIETTQEGCSPYRPVSNYLVVGRPQP